MNSSKIILINYFNTRNICTSNGYACKENCSANFFAKPKKWVGHLLHQCQLLWIFTNRIFEHAQHDSRLCYTFSNSVFSKKRFLFGVFLLQPKWCEWIYSFKSSWKLQLIFSSNLSFWILVLLQLTKMMLVTLCSGPIVLVIAILNGWSCSKKSQSFNWQSSSSADVTQSVVEN